MRARALGSCFAAALWLAASPALGAEPPLTLRVPGNGAQAALAVELASDGLWFRACSPGGACEARAGQRQELPPAVAQAAPTATLAVLELGPEQRVAHVRVPLGDVAWEAVLSAGAAPAEALVAFAGFTGLVRGEDGVRSGDAVWIRAGEKGQRVLVGRVREDVHLCGRRTLLEPRLLDGAGRLRPAKVQQLPLEERRAAPVLRAERRAQGPTGGGNALRSLAASSAIGDPGALTDGRDDSAWAEARGGDGRGEFVLLKPLSGVALVALEILVRGVGPSAPPNGAAPRSVWIATREQLFRLEWREDAWRSPGVWYRVALPAPIETDCLAIVLEQAFSDAPETAVTLSELRGVGELQGLAPAELVARLAAPGEDGAAAVPALLQLGDVGVEAVVGAFGALDATGRARALEVIERAPCEQVASLYAELLTDRGEESRWRAAQRLRACGAAAAPALRAAFERAQGAAGVRLARELAAIDAPLAVELLGPRLAAAPAELRPGYRDALSRAARDPDAHPSARRLLAVSGLGAAAELDVLRALSDELAALAPESAGALARAIENARGFEARYLLLAPASRLATLAPAAGSFIEAALRDEDQHLRLGAARVAPPRFAAALVALSRDPAVRVREAAAARLGEPGFAGATPALIERLRADDWPLVRSAAARSLAGAGPSGDADAALHAALDDGSADVRAAALRGIGQRGYRAAVPSIVERLRDPQEAPAVRASAARALGDLCDTSQLDELTRAAQALLADRPAPDDVSVGTAALGALGRLHPADLEQRLRPFADVKSRPALEQMVEAARNTAERCR